MTNAIAKRSCRDKPTTSEFLDSFHGLLQRLKDYTEQHTTQLRKAACRTASINCLPNETLASIVALVADDPTIPVMQSDSYDSDGPVPCMSRFGILKALVAVCSHWLELVRGTPSLWAILDREEDVAEALHRSQPCLISTHAEGIYLGVQSRRAAEKLLACPQRWRHMVLTLEDVLFPLLQELEGKAASSLEYCDIGIVSKRHASPTSLSQNLVNLFGGEMPSLTGLRLQGLRVPLSASYFQRVRMLHLEEAFFTSGRLLEVIRDSRALAVLHVGGLVDSASPPWTPKGPIQNEHLKRLTLLSNSGFHILPFVDVPNCASLHLEIVLQDSSEPPAEAEAILHHFIRHVTSSQLDLNLTFKVEGCSAGVWNDRIIVHFVGTFKAPTSYNLTIIMPSHWGNGADWINFLLHPLGREQIPVTMRVEFDWAEVPRGAEYLEARLLSCLTSLPVRNLIFYSGIPCQLMGATRENVKGSRNSFERAFPDLETVALCSHITKRDVKSVAKYLIRYNGREEDREVEGSSKKVYLPTWAKWDGELKELAESIPPFANLLLSFSNITCSCDSVPS